MIHAFALLRAPLTLADETAGAGLDWLVPWLAVGVLAGLAAAVIYLQRLARATEALGEQARQAGAQIESLHASLARFAATREDLDLRRLEHLLVDLRDQGARTEETLLRAVQAARAEVGTSTDGAGSRTASATWVERIENRLLSLGYSQVQVFLERGQLAQLDDASEREPVSVPVEALRRDVLHKGCVRVRAGRIVDVELNPPYAMFP
ncbi:MAG: hypothetical protein ACYS26_18485 [Planctomycetota bacterium]